MRTPWPVFAMELLSVAACFVLTGFAFGWGVAVGLFALLTVVLLGGVLVGRHFAKPS